MALVMVAGEGAAGPVETAVIGRNEHMELLDLGVLEDRPDAFINKRQEAMLGGIRIEAGGADAGDIDARILPAGVDDGGELGGGGGIFAKARAGDGGPPGLDGDDGKAGEQQRRSEAPEGVEPVPLGPGVQQQGGQAGGQRQDGDGFQRGETDPGGGQRGHRTDQQDHRGDQHGTAIAAPGREQQRRPGPQGQQAELAQDRGRLGDGGGAGRQAGGERTEMIEDIAHHQPIPMQDQGDGVGCRQPEDENQPLAGAPVIAFMQDRPAQRHQSSQRQGHSRQAAQAEEGGGDGAADDVAEGIVPVPFAGGGQEDGGEGGGQPGRRRREEGLAEFGEAGGERPQPGQHEPAAPAREGGGGDPKQGPLAEGGQQMPGIEMERLGDQVDDQDGERRQGWMVRRTDQGLPAPVLRMPHGLGDGGMRVHLNGVGKGQQQPPGGKGRQEDEKGPEGDAG